MSLYPNSIKSEAALKAMDAHSNINILGALIALCESNLGAGPEMKRLERKIVVLCTRESLAQLKKMDKATGRKDIP